MMESRGPYTLLQLYCTVLPRLYISSKNIGLQDNFELRPCRKSACIGIPLPPIVFLFHQRIALPALRCFKGKHASEP